MSVVQPRTDPATGPADEEIVARVLAGDAALFELLMRRHNQRVHRAVRAVLRDEAELEDAMQQAWLSAYANLARFEGAARFSTWLVRIAVNEALGRRRRAAHLALVEDPEETMEPSSEPAPDERAALRELGRLLESVVDALPLSYRTVPMLRDCEGMSTAETAQALGASEDVVKQRLHRARSLVRSRLEARVGEAATEAFAFGSSRCDRLVAHVMARILG